MARADPAARENQVLRELVAIYHHLTGLALQSADLQAVAALLAARVGALVGVVSPTLDVLAAAGPGRTPAEAAAGLQALVAGRRLAPVLSTVARTRRAMRLPGAEAPDPPDPGAREWSSPPIVIAPILVGEEVLASLLTVEPGPAEAGEDVSLLVTEHGATICGVVMSRERVVAAAAGRVRDGLVEGLLLGRATDPEELQRWARHLGYDGAHAHRVVVIAMEAPDEEAAPGRLRRLHDGLSRLVARTAPDAIVGARDREMVIVAREREARDGRRPEPAQLAAACLAHVQRLFPGTVLTIGVGGVCRDPSEVARAYAQARRTVGTLRRLGRHGRVVAFEDLGIHRLLLQVPDLDELRSFAREVIGPLYEHEAQHRSGLLRTLAVYLRENGSLQRAARDLHVHPNTITYRLNRLEAITGLDLGRYQDRLMAQVALEIVEALEER
ncbi:MAG TPA: helix-turn-helix domain-containing protein [Candidatus Dormibacteraeota bacterium]|nr:helix-turn-helix domain-containing protein [Candidatus Dormibacteraeota bacterium]